MFCAWIWYSIHLLVFHVCISCHQAMVGCWLSIAEPFPWNSWVNQTSVPPFDVILSANNGIILKDSNIPSGNDCQIKFWCFNSSEKKCQVGWQSPCGEKPKKWNDKFRFPNMKKNLQVQLESLSAPRWYDQLDIEYPCPWRMKHNSFGYSTFPPNMKCTESIRIIKQPHISICYRFLMFLSIWWVL